MATAQQNSSRAAALARRKAMSSGGKAAIKREGERTRSAPARSKPEVAARPAAAPAPAPQPASSSASSYRRRVVAAPASNPSRDAALARRKAMSNKGKSASMSKDRTRDASMVASSKQVVAETDAAKKAKSGDCGCGCGGKGGCGDKAVETAAPKARKSSRSRSKVNKPKIALNPSKAAALARRKAQSTRGKAGVSKGGMSQAQTARAANPELSSKELALELRRERSKRGKSGAGEQKTRPTGKIRPKNNAGAAQDAPWKVGVSETARGQSVTGTMVGRDEAVTGDEASTCRTVTGTEYLGADVFREFCQTDPVPAPIRTGMSKTGQGNAVTGNKVGRSKSVTGDEPGTCKNVTGTEYVGAGQSEAFCSTPTKPAQINKVMSETRKGKTVTGDNIGSFSNVTGGEAGAERQLTGAQYMLPGEAGREPAKVRVSETLRGGSVTGTAVGRSEKTTGDEFGSCRQITGDDYVGQEQYSDFCDTKAEPADQKVGVSATLKGMAVTGTMEGRSQAVTGNEPGTCKAVTGTPYAGVETYADYCEAPAVNNAAARMTPSVMKAGKNLTGQQPGVGGVMTGAEKGACESVSGTPYIGSDQMSQSCPSVAAVPGNSDFPQAVGDSGWEGFSVTPPSHAAAEEENTGVTGSRYEQGRITGPFGMADGKVTGTEDARFGNKIVNSSSVNETVAQEPQEVSEREKSRVTGEGMDGSRITGDDWDRGDRVTGTEGFSAMVRNPTVRGPMNAMANKVIADIKSEAPKPISRVTGSSGNYESGSLITYSGGARG